MTLHLRAAVLKVWRPPRPHLAASRKRTLQPCRCQPDQQDLGEAEDPPKTLKSDSQEIQRLKEQELQKSRNVAIATGAISIVIGVLYLLTVQLLDSRGVHLEPPPPEAFS